MLQNNSEKAYIIKPNKKIAQAIFLPLVKIAQLVLVEKRKELRITARGIQGFRFMDRIDVPVNMAEEKIIDKEEIIFIHQLISIPLYNQYMLAIERKVKNQAQIFETEATISLQICKYYITNNLWTKKMLSASIKTIETDELEKSRPITIYAA
ncbi:hypothetical protein G9A89_009373 [Geosiphon pyriformis]|nr:hypothetical protein G9A89_009373 [Geosiphon pyriformis]